MNMTVNDYNLHSDFRPLISLLLLHLLVYHVNAMSWLVSTGECPDT